MSLKFMKSRGKNEMAFERSEPRKLPYGRVEVNNDQSRNECPSSSALSLPVECLVRQPISGGNAPT